MTVLQHLVKNSILEDDTNNLHQKDWSIDQNSIRVEFDQKVVLRDYLYMGVHDPEILFNTLEFTAHCEAIYDIKSDDVKLGQTSIAETDKIAYRRFSDVISDSNVQYDVGNLKDYIALGLDTPNIANSIDLAIPRLLVEFFDLRD